MDVGYAQECLDYGADTGALVWRSRPRNHFSTDRACSTWNSRYAGKPAGTRSGACVSVRVGGARYKAHRVAWLLAYGVWPEGDVDHLDGDPENNALANLRKATNQQNQYNSRLKASNTSGYKGVCWDKPTAKWRAQICVAGRSVFLGHYATAEDAAAAYAEGAKRYAGEFARV